MKKSNKKIDSKSLISEISLLRKTLLNLNFQKSTGQLEKTAKIRTTRRKIASLKTKLNLEGVKNA